MNTHPEWRWLERIRGMGLFPRHRIAMLRDVFTHFAIKGLSCDIELPLVLATAASPAGLGSRQAAA